MSNDSKTTRFQRMTDSHGFVSVAPKPGFVPPKKVIVSNAPKKKSPVKD